MTTAAGTFLFGTKPRVMKTVAVVAGGYAVVPHAVVALDRWSVTTAPWLSGPLEPVVLLLGLVGLWPLAIAARHGEWFGVLGSGWLVGTAAIAFVPVLCNFAPAGKGPARPEPTPLEGGCIPAEGLAVYLAMALGVGAVLFIVNYAHWRLTTDSVSV